MIKDLLSTGVWLHIWDTNVLSVDHAIGLLEDNEAEIESLEWSFQENASENC